MQLLTARILPDEMQDRGREKDLWAGNHEPDRETEHQHDSEKEALEVLPAPELIEENLEFS
jgi:hypothetical protein